MKTAKHSSLEEAAMQKLTPEELKRNLNMFTGTEAYHRTGSRTRSTDGVVYLAQKAGCFWLLDIVDSVMHLITEEFAFADLKVTEDERGRRGEVLIHNGHDEESPAYRVFHRQKIDYTDFPLDEIRLYVQNGIILLPSEY
jgi:hypothetical protein